MELFRHARFSVFPSRILVVFYFHIVHISAGKLFVQRRSVAFFRIAGGIFKSSGPSLVATKATEAFDFREFPPSFSPPFSFPPALVKFYFPSMQISIAQAVPSTSPRCVACLQLA